jgi:cholesterol 7-dehydrogenase
LIVTKPLPRIHRHIDETSILDVPPAYPNGWFKLCNSRDVIKNSDTLQYIETAAFGNTYWLHRRYNDDQVICIEKPQADLLVTSVVPRNDIKLLERNGAILIWHHSEDHDPFWEPQEIIFDKNNATKTRERRDPRFHGAIRHYVCAHIQEIPENGADVAHFPSVHAPLWGILKFKWDAEWEAEKQKELQHTTNIKVTTQFAIGPITIPFVNLNTTIHQIGPGLVHLEFHNWFGRMMCIDSVTPVSPFLQRCEHLMYADWWIPRFMAKIALSLLSYQFERDILIWCNKKWLGNPVLVKEDHKIIKFRRWYRQFYH